MSAEVCTCGFNLPMQGDSARAHAADCPMRGATPRDEDLVFPNPSDAEKELLEYLRKYRNQVLERVAELVDDLLDEARDPWEIPGEIRKTKEL